MSLSQKFKKTNPQNKKSAPEQARGGNSTNYSLLKQGVMPYKYEEGTNLLRLLPQWAESPYPNFLEVNVLSFFDEMLPIRGTFRVTEENSWILSRMYKLLRAHPEFKHRLWSKENELGISFNPRPKVVFLGFNINDPEMKVVPIVLPGTVSYPAKDGKARIPQAGTRITQFVYDTDIHNNLRYGDIFDIETGRVIRLDVTNAGTIRAKYEPIADAAYPLTSKRFEKVLLQIKNFDEYVEEPSMSELVKVMKAYLPHDVFDYLDSQLNFDRIVENAGETPLERAAKPEPVQPASERSASLPLPEDGEDEPSAAAAEPADDQDAPMDDDDVEAKLQALRKEMAGRKGKK